MSTVLFIKANDRSMDQAVSVRLYHVFLDRYRSSHPEDTIVELDLYKENLPYLNNDMINGMYKSGKGLDLSPSEKKLTDIANRYLDQFLTADKVVFGFPMWNMTVPAVLHTYLDYLNQAGKTFRYTPEGAVGLVTGKKVALLNARGGIYSEGSNRDSEMAVKFLTKTMQFFGIQDITTLIIEGHNLYPEQTEHIIQKGLERAYPLAVQF
ncbi:FMN-dependent NADH-azoreductase [Kroppenstedtia pulmonis]|uniref:FMN dependent NADH:quinone oxidoreductase n=1 Tax=Kroppenstedtia pulmonis TaxID=1380685 RepID=A0A7D3XRC2_9BACL|nr:FMN-dependent NADH-azoreductase [Kroppenstedtia pulmonis]QKG84148.1 FMN-dependent NADH-azoreductase [Kroppenstedtia pulmonis]